MKRKKTSHIFLFWMSCFFSAIALFYIAAGIFESSKKTYLFFYADSELEYYRTVRDYYEKNSVFVSKQLLNDEVKSIIAQADGSNSVKEQDKLRQQLSVMLEGKYAELKKIDFDIMIFSLSGHSTFLSFGENERFGEYSGVRHSRTKFSQENHGRSKENFAVICGENDYIFRNSFPILEQNREVGHFELGMSLDAMKRMFRRKFGGQYGFMPYLPLTSGLPLQDSFQAKYILFPGMKDYWIEKQFLAANMLLPRIKDILTKRFAAGKPFCIYKNEDTFTFVPARSSSGDICGWIVHTDLNRKMVALYWIFIVSLGVAELVLVIIFIYINRLRQVRSELEDSIRNAEALNEAKSAFLTSIHHEIRTPLIGVLGMSDMLKETNPSPLQSEYIQIIRESGDSLLRTLNDIVELTRLEADKSSLQLSETELRDLIDVCFNLLRFDAEKKNLKFYYALEPELPAVVIADQARIRQILLILISTVIKLTSQGEVKLDVSSELIPNTDKIELKFATSDTDIEESSGCLETVADIFADKVLSEADVAQGNSCALALTIARKLAGVMNGKLKVKSDMGRSFSFVLTLPVGIKAESPASRERTIKQFSKPKTARHAKKNLRILIAEDDVINQKVLLAMLNDQEFEISIAQDGYQVLEKMKKSEFDIILMDCLMPKMDGITAAQKITEKYGDSRPVIIAVTANVSEENKQACLEAGMHEFMTKPVYKRELLMAISRWAPV